jgi:hypothetical protein
MNLALALGFIGVGGILMYAGVKGITISQVMSDIGNVSKGKGAASFTNASVGGGSTSKTNTSAKGAPELIK